MWLVVDTETTGLEHTKHSILSIGLLLVDNNFNPVGEPFEEFMLPTGEIDPEALRVNQIDIRNITQTREQVADKIIEWFTGLDITSRLGMICHSYPFDLNFMKQIPLEWGTIFDRDVLDTKIIATFLKACGAKIDKTSLSSLCELLIDENVKLLKPHGALNDCYRTLAVLKFFISAIKKPERA